MPGQIQSTIHLQALPLCNAVAIWGVRGIAFGYCHLHLIEWSVFSRLLLLNYFFPEIFQKIAYAKTDSDLIAKQKGTYKERGSKRKEEDKKKKKGKEAKGATAVPAGAAAAG